MLQRMCCWARCAAVRVWLCRPALALPSMLGGRRAVALLSTLQERADFAAVRGAFRILGACTAAVLGALLSVCYLHQAPLLCLLWTDQPSTSLAA